MDLLQQLLLRQLQGRLGGSANPAAGLLHPEAMPRVLDLLWSRLGGLNGKFFEAGWGNLSIVNLQQDVELIKQWPPKEMQVGRHERHSCCVSLHKVPMVV